MSQVFKCGKSFRRCFSSALIPGELNSGKESHCLTETGLSPELSTLNEASLANEINLTDFLALVSREILGGGCVWNVELLLFVGLFVSLHCFVSFFKFFYFNFKPTLLYACLLSPFCLTFSPFIFITLLSPSLSVCLTHVFLLWPPFLLWFRLAIFCLMHCPLYHFPFPCSLHPFYLLLPLLSRPIFFFFYIMRLCRKDAN